MSYTLTVFMSLHIRVVWLIVKVIDVDRRPGTRSTTANLDGILILRDCCGIIHLASWLLAIHACGYGFETCIRYIDRWRSTMSEVNDGTNALGS